MEKINFQDLPSTSTPLNSTNLNQMQDNMEDAIVPIKLVTISDTAPGTATIGDMYYNTTDNKVYTAVATNTWDSGTTPRYDGFYINTNDNTLFYYNGSTLIGVGGSGSSATNDSLPIGMIMPSASQGSMTDWLKCDGSAVSRTEYSELFNAIGVSYGSGDGSTTFNLPNIKGKMIIGYDPDDDDFDTIGATGGGKTHTITQSELPQFNYIQPTGTNTGHGTSNQGVPNTYTNDWASIGNNQTMNIMNPYIILNYYIKAHKTAPIYATVKNEETTSETDVYSCNYINNMKVNITIDGGPVKTGRIIAGKEEYIDVLNVGTGPNNTEIQVDYTTSNKFITDYYLIGISSNNETIKAPNAAALNQFFNVFLTDNKIAINSNQDRTRFTCYVYVSFIYTN